MPSRIAAFSDTTGKLLGDSGKLVTDFAALAHTHNESEVVGLTSDLAAKAPLASPALTGVPTGPTAAALTSTTQLSTTAFVTGAVAARAYTAPGGTLPMSFDAKLDEVVSVTGWMSTPYNSAADHTSWLLNVIDKVHTQLGGATVGLYFPHPVYNLSDTLEIPWSGINLLGRGQGTRLSTRTLTRASAQTHIMASASFPTTKPLVKWDPAAGGDRIIGGGLQRMCLDGNDRAKQVLVVNSCLNLLFSEFHFFGATAEQILSGLSARALTGVYSPQYVIFQHGITHNLSGAFPAALCMRLTGNSDAAHPPIGNVNNFLFLFNRYNAEDGDCVLYECTDSCRSFGEGMSSRLNDTTHNGLILGSADQDSVSITDKSAARYHSFHSLYAVNTRLKAGQTGLASPSRISFYDMVESNGGGDVIAETPAGGSTPPHAIAYDSDNGVRVWGNSVRPYVIHGVDEVHLVDGITTPGTTLGYAKEYVHSTDGSLKVRFGDGTIKVMAPKANVLAQTITSLPNGAAALAGTIANSPRAGNPTKWIPIDDNGTTRYIPAW